MKFTKKHLRSIKSRVAEHTGMELPQQSISVRKVVLVAAMVVMLCSVSLTACAVNFLGIRDMIMERSGKKYVTIAGFQNSPEYMALMEWDSKRPSRQTVQGPEVTDPIHHQYGAHAESAKKTLDGIMEKYGLQPYSQFTPVYDGDPQSLYDAVGKEDFLPESCSPYRGTTDPDSPGCSVRNGITVYSFSDRTTLSDGTQVGYEFDNCAKGYMQIFMGQEIDAETVTQWSYTAKDGTELLLWQKDDQSSILADFPGSFLTIIAVGIDDDNGRYTLNREQLEEFAELFDYTVIQSIGDSEK